MNKALRIIIGVLVFVLSACGGSVASTPTVASEPISISAHLNGDGNVVVNSNFSYTTQSKSLGNSWNSGLAATTEDANGSVYTLYFLSQDEQDNVIQNSYEIGQPFNITFSQSDWVESITHLGQGNLIVAVQGNRPWKRNLILQRLIMLPHQLHRCRPRMHKPRIQKRSYEITSQW